MHSQVGQASNSEQACRPLLCSIVDIMNMMCSMYQWVSLEMKTTSVASLGYLLLYLLSLIVTIIWFWCYVLAITVLCFFVYYVASGSQLRGCWNCMLYSSKCAHCTVHICSHCTSRFGKSYESTISCKAETFGYQQMMKLTQRHQKTKFGGFNTVFLILHTLHAIEGSR